MLEIVKKNVNQLKTIKSVDFDGFHPFILCELAQFLKLPPKLYKERCLSKMKIEA